MNQIDEIAHLIQLSVAQVFLLTGVGTLLNVLSADIRHVFRLHVTEQVPMHGVLGAIGSQPLGFPFRTRRSKEVIFLCKATVVEQRLELFQFIRFGGRVQPVSRVPCEGDNKSKTILEIEFPRILKKPRVQFSGVCHYPRKCFRDAGIQTFLTQGCQKEFVRVLLRGVRAEIAESRTTQG